ACLKGGSSSSTVVKVISKIVSSGIKIGELALNILALPIFEFDFYSLACKITMKQVKSQILSEEFMS
ncbi:MAG: hypothetical protein IIT94_03200, partial [Prevotella sp.]|nr:hypothetical protein [Prevotella sp.]